MDESAITDRVQSTHSGDEAAENVALEMLNRESKPGMVIGIKKCEEKEDNRRQVIVDFCLS